MTVDAVIPAPFAHPSTRPLAPETPWDGRWRDYFERAARFNPLVEDFLAASDSTAQ